MIDLRSGLEALEPCEVTEITWMPRELNLADGITKNSPIHGSKLPAHPHPQPLSLAVHCATALGMLFDDISGEPEAAAAWESFPSPTCSVMRAASSAEGGGFSPTHYLPPEVGHGGGSEVDAMNAGTALPSFPGLHTVRKHLAREGKETCQEKGVPPLACIDAHSDELSEWLRYKKGAKLRGRRDVCHN